MNKINILSVFTFYVIYWYYCMLYGFLLDSQTLSFNRRRQDVTVTFASVPDIKNSSSRSFTRWLMNKSLSVCLSCCHVSTSRCAWVCVCDACKTWSTGRRATCIVAVTDEEQLTTCIAISERTCDSIKRAFVGGEILTKYCRLFELNFNCGKVKVAWFYNDIVHLNS